MTKNPIVVLITGALVFSFVLYVCYLIVDAADKALPNSQANQTLADTKNALDIVANMPDTTLLEIFFAIVALMVGGVWVLQNVLLAGRE